MKRKYLSSIMIILLANALLTGVACLCASGDCHAAITPDKAKIPQCHHEAGQTKTENPSGKDCCGKCQIEKAAVITETFSSSDGIYQKSDPVKTGSIANLKATAFPPFFFGGNSSGPPHDFFIQHVLITTFSFRAPPQG